jgi:hypothetical protein
MKGFLHRFFNTPETPRVEASRLGVSSIRGDQDVFNFEWKGVTLISAFKHDLVTYDEVVLEFTLLPGNEVVAIPESLSEFEVLIRFLEDTWPRIPKDWRQQVLKPAFAENKIVLFTAPTE